MLKKTSCRVHLPKVYLVQETEFGRRSSAIFKMFSEENPMVASMASWTEGSTTGEGVNRRAPFSLPLQLSKSPLPPPAPHSLVPQLCDITGSLPSAPPTAGE